MTYAPPSTQHPGDTPDLPSVPRSVSEVVAEVLALLLVAGGVVYSLVAWSGLPARIPTHLDVHGTINGYGSRNVLLLLPVITAAVYALLTLVSRHPRFFNYPVKPGAGELAEQRRLARWFLSWMKVGIAGLFGVIGIVVVSIAKSKGPAVSTGTNLALVAVIGVGVAFELGLVVSYLVRSRRIHARQTRHE